MFNRLEAFTECGERVARATNENDGARAAHEKRYFTDMLLCENAGPDRDAARAAFDTAYTRVRNVPKVKTWR